MPPSVKTREPFFQPFDCVPDRSGWKQFRQNLLLHGGQSNDYGDSYASVFLGNNMGGPDGEAFPQASTKDRDRLDALQANRSIRSEAFTYLIRHIGSEIQKTHVFEHFGPAARTDPCPNPLAAFKYLKDTCDIPDSVELEEEHQQRWLNTTIPRDVGISMNSVRDIATELRTQVSEMTEAQQALYTEDVIAEKVLRQP